MHCEVRSLRCMLKSMLMELESTSVTKQSTGYLDSFVVYTSSRSI